MISKENNLLEVDDLKAYFPINHGLLSRTHRQVRAVDGISFNLRAGESLGVVGESGSGKTTLGRCIVGLTKVTEGTIRLRREGNMVDLASLDRSTLNDVRREISMLFQDPNSSLNPRLRILDIIAEPLRIHHIGTAAEQHERVVELLVKVGLSSHHINMFPHQFSGGQRQRIGIARALAIGPPLLICDEPVSALDFSVQAQVLNLLADLQDEFELTYLFIAHDLSVVEYISDRVMVMYLGHAVEIAPSSLIYQNPRHPYTEALLGSIPRHLVGVRRPITVPGGMPDPSNPPRGCVFHTRCPYTVERCRQERPELVQGKGGDSSLVACHLAGELNLKGYG